MAKRASKEYIASQQALLESVAKEPDTLILPKGVLYKVLASGEGEQSPEANSIVGVHYRGTLSNGREFDSSLMNSYPAIFPLRELIVGWQIALRAMRVGDKWRVYIPSEVGYGERTVDNIPGCSTLIFEIELVSIN